MKRLIQIILLVFICSITYSQTEYSTKSKKAIKLFKEAIVNYNVREDNDALIKLNSAIKIDEKFIEAYLLKANIYHDKKSYKSEISEYNKIIEIDPLYSYKTYFFLGQAYLKVGEYKNALTNLIKVNEFKNIKATVLEQNSNLINQAKFGIFNIENPKIFLPISLGPNINSEYDEYWPSLTVDEQLLVITRLIPSAPGKIVNQLGKHEDFYYSNKVNGNWEKAVNMGSHINTDNNEGAMSVSADGKMFFYTVCNRPEDFGSCDIYYSMKKDGKWTKPKNIGNKLNSRFWESNPSFSADGKTLYFVSNRTGGFGKMDIWKSEIISIDNNGQINWTNPLNVGNVINTSENEFAPFVHPDNVTLYFTSDGHIGMGGTDIFYSKYNDKDSSWTPPINIGYPINTYNDENGMIVNALGELAYFTSNRDSINGLDIFSFELYNEARPTKVNFVKGKIFDSETKIPLNAKFELYCIENNKLIITSYSDSETGAYLVSLPTNKNYAFNAYKDGYLFYSENFSLKNNDNNEPYLLDIPLQPIKVNAKIVLKNIFYETDSYELKSESLAELNKLVLFMKNNINVNIEISGHTDNVGTKEYNIKLSENRAKSVYEFLMKNDIERNRLSYLGLYFLQPIADNNTQEGKALNRRTEFKITTIKK